MTLVGRLQRGVGGGGGVHGAIGGPQGGPTDGPCRRCRTACTDVRPLAHGTVLTVVDGHRFSPMPSLVPSHDCTFDELRVADHIYTVNLKGVFTHHGIVVEKGSVPHPSPHVFAFIFVASSWVLC